MNQMSDPFLIFIVDDESSIAETTAHIFHREGFLCVPFSDPLDLIDHCAATPPNFVISDIIMPQMSGFDLANRLRDTHPQCRILLFTGKAGVDDLREYALELGHDIEVLSKPLHPLKLIERVKIISGEQISKGSRRYPGLSRLSVLSSNRPMKDFAKACANTGVSK